MAARPGVTLVELLIVLAILGIVATLVVPGTASVFRVGASEPLSAASVLDSARHLAVTRGATVRVRIQGDGQWLVGVPGEDGPLAAGRLPERAVVEASDLLIDPLGTCRPSPTAASPRVDDGRPFDAGRCRWQREDPFVRQIPP